MTMHPIVFIAALFVALVMTGIEMAPNAPLRQDDKNLPTASPEARRPERQAAAPTYLRTEYAVNPLGIDVRKPRLSWLMVSDRRGARQTAYQVQVAATQETLEAASGLTWDTGRIDSDRSIHVPYDGPGVESGARYWWRVRIWDEAGAASDWSDPAFWEMGLLDPFEWRAEWISADAREDPDKSQPPWMYRKPFQLRQAVRSARAYVSSLGLYEMEINGSAVGDQVFTPGWTSYDNRIQYQVYDVTDHLSPGDNVVGATVGDGWYRGFLAFRGGRNLYGDQGALILELRILYEDGSQETVATDETWTAAQGPIRMSDIYMGETYDARLERPGWSAPGTETADRQSVVVLDHPKNVLVASAGPAVKRMEEIRPVEILATPAGETVFDMGQNMVGRVRIRVEGPAGTTLTLRHAEVLDGEGNIYTENLRAATQSVTYTLRGGGPETYEPHFTFQGFRYVAVDGWPGTPTPDDLTGIVIHSDMPVTGHFETSDSLLNQLQHNIIWGQKGNFLDVPTDCPQRDERLGWTGDAQVFSRTAAFNMDVASFFSKWLKDLAADQEESGRVPHVVPDVLNQGGAAAWADAGVIIPWNMYLAYGDTRVLEAQYPSMKAWVEYMRRRAGDDRVWTEDFTFGDWLAYSTNQSDYPGATTGKDFVSTAYFAHSTDLLSRTAAVLGLRDEAAEYARLFEEIKAAFNREFVTETGRVAENTQTAYTVALAFELLPESLRTEAAARLAADVRSRDNHLTTGFVGTPDLCHVLSGNGHLETAYALLFQDTYPSWLYPVKQGATTIWERWDGIRPDGTFQDRGMNSFNHYAYGAIGDWMYRVVAGIDIDPENPGYKHTFIRPQPGTELAYVQAGVQSMYGEVGSRWAFEGDTFTLTVRVPPNATASIRLPGASLGDVRESGGPLAEAYGLTRSRDSNGAVVVEAAAGTYEFTYPASGLRPGEEE